MKHYTLWSIQQIKQAVDSGKTVKVDNDAYEVIKDKIGQYLIKCNINDTYIGLHGQKGTQYENTLNGGHFYYTGE